MLILPSDSFSLGAASIQSYVGFESKEYLIFVA